jgi:hypothetical protein
LRRDARQHRREGAGDHRDDREDDDGHERERERDVEVVQRPGDDRRDEDPQRQSERRADQRHDHAVVADHAARLAAGEADGPQHPKLARTLEDGERQGVHHAEEAGHLDKASSTYRPAAHLLREQQNLLATLNDETLDRFEELFKRANALLS